MNTALVAYESWFGYTRAIAEQLAEGLRAAGVRTECARIDDVAPGSLATVDLVVLGAPTHAHSLPTPTSRLEARKWAEDDRKGLRLDADPEGHGMREWIESLPNDDQAFASFCTRAHLPELLTGSAAHAIARRLERKGWREFASPESFIVPQAGELSEDEMRRARFWGRQLSSSLRTRQAPAAH